MPQPPEAQRSREDSLVCMDLDQCMARNKNRHRRAMNSPRGLGQGPHHRTSYLRGWIWGICRIIHNFSKFSQLSHHFSQLSLSLHYLMPKMQKSRKKDFKYARNLALPPQPSLCCRSPGNQYPCAHWAFLRKECFETLECLLKLLSNRFTKVQGNFTMTSLLLLTH